MGGGVQAPTGRRQRYHSVGAEAQPHSDSVHHSAVQRRIRDVPVVGTEVISQTESQAAGGIYSRILYHI